MLVAWCGGLSSFIRSLDPVPSSISVPPQSPSICETWLISCSATKTNHHSCSWACLAESCWMINSCAGHFFSCVEFVPRKWSSFYTQAPYIINWFLSGVASKHKQMGFRKYDGMAIPSSWSWAHDWDNHPLSHLLSIPHIEQIQIITCQTSAYSDLKTTKFLNAYLQWRLRRLPSAFARHLLMNEQLSAKAGLLSLL